MSERKHETGMSGVDFARQVSLARGGCSEALGNVFQQCRDYLLLVAEDRLGADVRAKEGASDLVQETFLQAQGDFPRFRGASEAEVLAWLRQILVHNLADLVRRYRGTEKRQIEREASLEQDSSLEGFEEQLAADATSPSPCAMLRERNEQIERALRRLSDRYRTVIVLRHQEDTSFKEIGRTMNLSAEAARRLWARAVKRLQRELEPPDES